MKKKMTINFNVALILILIVSFGFVASRSSAFLQRDYIVDVVLRNVVEIGFLALPMTMIIITGGIDLSCGNIMVLSAMLGGMAAVKFGSAAGVLITLFVGCVCGFVNGFIIAKIHVPAMVTTLATMYLYLGVARGLSKGDSIYSYPATLFMGNQMVFGVPIQIWMYVILAIVFVLILHKTVFGRKIFAIGLNANAVAYTGINVERTIITAYVLEGCMAALAALVWIGRFASLKYDAGTNLHMKAITIVVLGGTSILGGIGDMKGTIIATLIIAVLNSGLTVMGIPIDAQTIVQGTVLLISLMAYAVIMEYRKRKRLVQR